MEYGCRMNEMKGQSKGRGKFLLNYEMINRDDKHETTRTEYQINSVNKKTDKARDKLEGIYWRNEGWQIAKQTMMKRITICRQCTLRFS
jgi:hypothetical protein